MADAWGGSWGLSWLSHWGTGVTPTPAPSTGGGGASGGRRPTNHAMSAAERRRFTKYMRQIAAKRAEDAAEEARLLEIAWNKAHGIVEPVVPSDVPQAIAQLVADLPPKAAPERSAKAKAIMSILAGLRAEMLAALDAERARQVQEDDDLAVVLLLTA